MTRPIARLLALLLLAAACDGGGGGGPNDTGAIAAEAGGGQSATVGSALTPYQVKLTDAGGAPKAGVTVTWSVQSGGGSVSPGSSVSDQAGIAEATATLSLVSGQQVVRASAAGYQGSPVSFTSTGIPDAPVLLSVLNGNNQSGPPGGGLPNPLVVRVLDQHDNPVPGVTVDWLITAGGGGLSAPSSVTNATGLAQVSLTLPATPGSIIVSATVAALAQTVTFTASAVSSFAVLAGGNNVPERYGSDLWLADGFGYSGTWGFRGQQGNAVKVWQLGPTGAPTLKSTLTVANVGTISDLEVSPDGKWLVLTAEGGSAAGLHVYELTTPGTPVPRASLAVSGGLHTGSLAVIGGTLYLFGAKNPSSPAMVVYDLSQAATGTVTIASSTPVPANYGIHDTFVRAGICFAFVWNDGVHIYDVGGAGQGGTPQAPVKLGQVVTAGGQVHNGWWFHNPVSGQQKYLFVGEEGPGIVGASSSGDIHVVDVSDFTNPVEVGTYHLNGAGVHNFWMDEANQRLYAAYYNGGVVALDVSGTLTGNLASREVDRIQPGGAGNTFVWGVMLYGGSLYVSDMISGFWQLRVP